MNNEPTDPEIAALQSIINALASLPPESRARLLRTIGVYFETRDSTSLSVDQIQPFTENKDGRENVSRQAVYSGHKDISAKEFLFEKQPRSDVERVACLAYYLTHFRATPYFKTLDISILNTEAAQPKFSNAAYAVNNAVKMRYLVPALKGTRQLSAVGEQFVLALPNRDAASEALRRGRRRTIGSTDRAREKKEKGKSNSGFIEDMV